MWVGRVIKIYDTDLFNQKVKWFIVVGDKGGQLACIYINTETRPIDLTPELQGSQLPLLTAQCAFLDHDSFADCSYLMEKDKGQINEILQKEGTRYLGDMPQNILLEIIRLVRVSDSVETIYKKKYGLME